MTHHQTRRDLPLPLPAKRHEALGLVLFRRIAAHGPADARATMLAMDVAGSGFRRLTVLARSLVVGLAQTSQRKIQLAPCCAIGMTRDEGLLIAMIAGGGLDIHAALTDDAPCYAAMHTAHTFGKELAGVAIRQGWRA